MEEPIVEPRVHETLQLIDKRIGKPVHCPCCDRTEWRPIQRDTFLIPTVRAETDADAGEAPEVSEPFGVIHGLALFCMWCGFARFHVLSAETLPREDAEAPE